MFLLKVWALLHTLPHVRKIRCPPNSQVLICIRTGDCSAWRHVEWRLCTEGRGDGQPRPRPHPPSSCMSDTCTPSLVLTSLLRQVCRNTILVWKWNQKHTLLIYQWNQPICGYQMCLAARSFFILLICLPVCPSSHICLVGITLFKNTVEGTDDIMCS